MGAIFCLLSAAAFGAMAIFGKLAYDEGVTVGDLLLVRFGVAAVVMLAIVRWRGGFGALPRRTAVAAFAMGASATRRSRRRTSRRSTGSTPRC